MEFLKTYKQFILLAVLIIFHTVGIFGLLSDSRAYFLGLSPMNLLLSVLCLWISFKTFSQKRLLDFMLVGIVGFSVELIGIHTGLLFGNYVYGANLGWKLFDVPVIIAANWVMLSYASVAFVVRLKTSIVVKALLSASIMTALDFLIEPVAVASDFWSWHNGIIPVYNYVCWWIISFFVHLWIIKRKTSEQNPVAVGLFVILILFFGILNFV
ncbi:MAG: carotenoid biosynthesis protein [Fluviicola sp.]|nr:carotenoid biosynthesis protein [Fluviicola sp.]